MCSKFNVNDIRFAKKKHSLIIDITVNSARCTIAAWIVMICEPTGARPAVMLLFLEPRQVVVTTYIHY